MNAQIGAQSLDAWKSYLRWRAIHDAAKWLSRDPFSPGQFQILRLELLGRKELTPRWKRCVSLTDERAGRMRGAGPYVEKTLGEDRQKHAQKWCTALEKALGQISSRPGLDDAEDQEQAVVKLHGITQQDRLSGANGGTTRTCKSCVTIRMPIPARAAIFEASPQSGQDRQARGQDRLGHEPAHGERLLRSAAERHQLSRRHSAAAVL